MYSDASDKFMNILLLHTLLRTNKTADYIKFSWTHFRVLSPLFSPKFCTNKNIGAIIKRLPVFARLTNFTDARWSLKILHNPWNWNYKLFHIPTLMPANLLLKRDVMKFERSLNRLTMMNATYNFCLNSFHIPQIHSQTCLKVKKSIATAELKSSWVDGLRRISRHLSFSRSALAVCDQICLRQLHKFWKIAQNKRTK